MKKYHLVLLSLLSGLLFAISWPERGFPYLIFFAWVPLLTVESYITDNPFKFGKLSVFLYSYISFFIWNLLTTYWIWNSTEVGGAFAVLFNSLLMSVVFSAFHYTRKKVFVKLPSYWVLIFYWIAFEFFHLDWDLSWPWLTLGNVFSNNVKIVQWYEYTGVFGGSLWILIINILIFNIFKIYLEKTIHLKRKQLLTNITALFVILIVPISFSYYKYNNYVEKGKTVNVIVVQPNLDPYSEQYSVPPLEVLDKMLQLANQKLDTSVDCLVFPESALQEYIWEEDFDLSPSIVMIRGFLKNYPKLNILAGLSSQRLIGVNEPLTLASRPLSSEPGRYYEPFNTALHIDTSSLLQKYHKSKLTPGVEKMPFKKFFKPIEKFAIDLGGTVGSLGIDTERKVYNTHQGFKYNPVICYESIYGEFVGQFVRNGSEIIFIITNDGWWGNTAGHRQHFSYARLRAIETRRDIARSANTGISGFINQRGDVLQRTNYWEPNVIRQKLITNDIITFYTKYGDYIGRISNYISLLLIILTLSKALKRKGKLTS